ncbi:hypothetical protein EYF80_057582 [Liparis tanakae]|uniref:Uncharacterized protein n=1 Tax=Liparis tanakae TaxID=230148 RepID=A0A4Z2EUE2_9TELE|nr:hypothetical protein EYF80_057582 [Liparis tanakae]
MAVPGASDPGQYLAHVGWKRLGVSVGQVLGVVRRQSRCTRTTENHREPQRTTENRLVMQPDGPLRTRDTSPSSFRTGALPTGGGQVSQFSDPYKLRPSPTWTTGSCRAWCQERTAHSAKLSSPDKLCWLRNERGAECR